VFADAEVDVASLVLLGKEIACAFENEIGLVGLREVGGAADEPGNILRQGVEDFAGTFARGHALGIGGKDGEILVPAIRQFAALDFVELRSEIWELFGVIGEELIPFFACIAPADTDAGAEVIVDTVGDEELGVFGPAVVILDQLDFGFAEGLAVGFVGILLVGRAVTDVTVDDDERGLVVGFEGYFVATREHHQVVGIGDAGDVPAVADEAGHHIFAEGPTGGAIEGDAIVVVDPAKIGELQMAGERRGLARYAFHQVTIAADGVDAEIEQVQAGPVVIRGQPFSGNGHADAVGDTLAERAGGGFHAGGDVRFGVARSLAAELAEAFDFVERDGEIFRCFTGLVVHLAHTGKVQCGIEKHGGVTGRENETVAIRPGGIGRIVIKKIVPEGVDDGGETHGRAGMAGIGLLNSVDGKSADGIDTKLI